VLPVNGEPPFGEQSGEPFLDGDFDEIGIVRCLDRFDLCAAWRDIGDV
jgi:hypothetical protein